MRLFVLSRHAHTSLNEEGRINGDPSVPVALTELGRARHVELERIPRHREGEDEAPRTEDAQGAVREREHRPEDRRVNLATSNHSEAQCRVKEARAGLGNHGEAAIVEWKKTRVEVDSDGVTLWYGADLPKTQYRVERAVSLPAAANDWEGSSPVAFRASSRALQSLSGTSREPISRTLDNIVPSNHCCKLFHLARSCAASHTGFDSPSLKLPRENRVSAPPGVSTLAQTNGPWSASVKVYFQKACSSRIAEQPRLPLCRTELW